MTDPSPNPLSENAAPLLSSSAEPTPPKKSLEESLRENFPDSFRPPTANPLVPPNYLTDAGWARRRLGLTDLDMRGVPKITRRVKEAVGTVRAAVRILEGDDAPDSIKFCQKWNSLSKKDKLAVHLEDVVIAAGLTPRRFMELLAGAGMEYSSSISKLIVTKNQPKVLKATIKAAITETPIVVKGNVVGHNIGDIRAQELFHKMSGALPTPKGPSIILNQLNQTANIEPPSPKERTPLESMDSFLLELEDIRKPKQLAARAEPIIPVEMPVNAPEIEYLGIED